MKALNNSRALPLRRSFACWRKRWEVLERVARIELATFSLGSSKGLIEINAVAPNWGNFGLL